MRTTKRLDLPRLKQELLDAGIDVPSLGFTPDDVEHSLLDGDVYTYDPTGKHTIDLPPGAAAVLAAHVAPPISPKANYGNDATSLDAQAAAAVTQLRAFVANATPTNAEAIANAKLQNRVLLALIRQQGY